MSEVLDLGGIRCFACKSTRSQVYDSRSSTGEPGRKWRRRECLDCGSRWTTEEVSRDELLDIERKLQQFHTILELLGPFMKTGEES